MNRPRLFLSAVSEEFSIARLKVANILITLGYEVVFRDSFETGHGELCNWLRERIDSCEGLIQLVGIAYGEEPPNIDNDFGLVSYTQFEFLYAYRSEKKTWIIVAEDDYIRDKTINQLDLPSDHTHPDPTGYQAERRKLQQEYIDWLRNENHLIHYANSYAELELIIRKLSIARPKPFLVDDLPKNFVYRPKEFDAILEQLLDVQREEPLAITTSLRGAGGYGKTTIAIALCYDKRIREAYSDGILWITLGEKPGDLTEKIKDLIEKLSGQRPRYSDENSAAAHLSELLADQDILIVIDDVWNSEHVIPFLRGGPRCSRLITTRNSDTLPIGCSQIVVDDMKSYEALSLLGYGLPHSDKKELKELSERLGRWPLLLKLVNKYLIERVVNRGQPLSSAITFVFKRLNKYGITAFDARNSEGRSQAVEVTLSVSLELLSHEEKGRFDDLAIFPEDTAIPLETVEKLWMHAGIDELDAEYFCEQFYRLSLLLNFDPTTRMIRLHDVIRNYLRKKNERQLPRMHTRFLDSYGLDQWVDLPNTEPYLWKNLAYHLVDSRESNRLKNLLFDYSWLKRKLVISDVNVLLADFKYLPNEKELSLVQQALELSSNQLTRDPDQLSPHLIGRLKDIQSPGIQQLLSNAAFEEKKTWFKPFSCSLISPSGPLLRTFEAHNDGVETVEISSDGKTALSGSWDNTLILWDLSTGQVLKTLEGHSEQVTAVAISPDGRIALSGSWDGTIKFWDLIAGESFKTIESDVVEAIAISPDGRTALTSSYDNTLKLLDLSTGRAINNYNGHNLLITSVAISPDGRTALSGSISGDLKMWDLCTGVLLKVLQDTDNSGLTTCSIAISPDGKMALSGKGDILHSGNAIELWDLKTGKLLNTYEGHKNGVNAVAISPDGKWAISGSEDMTLKLWNLSTWEVTNNFEGHSDAVSSVAFSPDSKTALSGSHDNTLKLWDLNAGKFRNTQKAHSEWVKTVVISADSKSAVSYSTNNTLKIWDLSTGKLLNTHKSDKKWFGGQVVSSDCKSAMFCSSDGTLKLLDLHTGEVGISLECKRAGIILFVLSHDGKIAVSASTNNKLKLWDLLTGKVLHTLTGQHSRVKVVAISPDGKKAIFSYNDKNIKIWDLTTGQISYTFEGHRDIVSALSISSDSKTVFSGSWDNIIKRWDFRTGKVLNTYKIETGKDNARSSYKKTDEYDSDGSFLRSWKSAVGGSFGMIEEYRYGVTALVIGPDGKTALSGTDDHTLRLWDCKNGKVIASFIGESTISCIAISPCGRIVLAGDIKGNLHFLKLENNEEKTYQKHV